MNNDDALNDLFKSWQHGDENSFEKLYNRLFPHLLKFATDILKDDGLSEELVMDIFFKIWNKKEKLNLTGNIKHYLYKCVRYGVIDHYRKKALLFQSIDELNHDLCIQSACDTKIINDELEYHYNYAISQLSPKRQQIYKLSRIEGMSYKEIASHTGLSIKTIENHIAAALQFLRTYLRKADIIFIILFFLHIFFN